jgi:predicted nucleic acid-binding protein
MARFALDTNILVYAEALNGPDRQRSAVTTLARIDRRRLLLPTQVLGELFNVMTRKFNKPRSFARERISAWCQRFDLHAADTDTFTNALELSTTQGLQIWDAVILATAADAGCIALLSEDMQHGFVYRGVTVINPFAEPTHPLLADALQYQR